MWFVLGLLFLFVAYCWLDSGGLSSIGLSSHGLSSMGASASSISANQEEDYNVFDDEVTSMSTSHEKHQMGFMTEDTLL